ncbi:MAG TPA: hypothetical protein VFO34_15130 [Candidatus Acidoferrales bacterium]|nr:hypothetical protein [Candidatus Acidoferrales bacterium]
MARTAPAPEGPWSDELKIFQAARPQDGTNVYDAQAHPEYSEDGSRVMFITYSRATAPFASEIRIVRLEFARSSVLSP